MVPEEWVQVFLLHFFLSQSLDRIERMFYIYKANKSSINERGR